MSGGAKAVGFDEDRDTRGSVASPGRPQVFYIQVTEEDTSMFLSFRNNVERFDHMWGLRSNEDEAWKAIRPGDIVYMGLSTNPALRVCGRVSHTSIDYEIPKTWGLERMLDMTRIIHFSHLRHVHVLHEDLIRHGSISRGGSAYTLSQVLDNCVDDVMYEWPHRGDIFVPPEVAPPVDYISPPDAVEHVTIRSIRDTEGARGLKELYGDKCQVCGYALEGAAGSRHSEVHHLRPLHEGGADTHDNMVVLCARHHAEFDYGATCVGESGEVVGRGAADGGRLSFRGGHRLDPGNVRHAMRGMAGAAGEAPS